MAESAVHLIARGRVQGVGFRFFVRQEAAGLGVVGWVRNCADGSVEIHAEGSRDQLNDLVDTIREGPAFGSVSDLDVDWIEPTGRYNAFSIAF